MHRRPGKSNLQVSPLCLGTMMFGEQTGRDEAPIDSLVRPGHPSTAGYTDPAYPLGARVRGPISQ